MNINLVPVKPKEREILYRLLEFSLYDGSQYVNNDMDNFGVFPYTYFDNYFKDNDREAYFIKYNNNLVGFTMLNKNLKILPHDENNYSVAEFLIIPKYRRMHLGTEAAYKVFDLHEGLYEVQPMENNPVAQKFWDKVINDYSYGSCEINHFVDMEDVYVFESRNKDFD